MYLKRERAEQPRCPQCRGTLEEGAVMERGSTVRPQQVWIPTASALPQAAELQVTPRQAPRPVRTLRCSRCGFVASYAL